MLSAQAFEQMRQVPELVFLSTERLALIEHQGDREAALRRSMVAALRMLGVRCVVAAGTLLPDDVAGQFSKEFFEAMATRGATVEQAMLSARSLTLRSHPKLNTWSAYQVYGDPDYRFPLASA